ncbi:hypothetical protein N9N03_01050 [Chlamydiia bacterium]|nr:hypothetical protein [Chlamydiia bacterium]
MIIHLPLQCNIFDQLILEETLHKNNQDNFFITNFDSEQAIVLGRYCQHDEWISSENNIDLVRRYSGGGVVVVDPNTLFLSLLVDIRSIGIKPYPKDILEWSMITCFRNNNIGIELMENDWVINNKKVGGNALAIHKNRVAIHMCFLWDYNPTLMKSLKQPPRSPDYRNSRPHASFLTTLNDKLCSPTDFFEMVVRNIQPQKQLKTNQALKEVSTYNNMTYRTNRMNKMLAI